MVLSYFIVACMVWFGVPNSCIIAGIASFSAGYLLKQREVGKLKFELGELRRSLSNFSEKRNKELVQSE
ncbi:putative membrane protein [Lausannevirus]|uniref:Putative membrane protein n=1 Tax=Lausannevirus TaxID=999883 RepID=F2WKY3_9VIRU|nr:hypothetical protein LAU_0050 [Lausannevirus]AEA06906.1 putative membrane protein [Lausannevirus]